MEEENTELLIGLLEDRLRDSGGRTVAGEHIFSEKELVSYLRLSISEFNSIPPFTFFTLKDEDLCNVMSAVIVRLAYSLALSSQALTERGREFIVKDTGVDYVPPKLSELLVDINDVEYIRWREQVQMIKGDARFAEFWMERD